MDERHLRAERGPRLRHLDSDDSSAEDEEAAGYLFRRRRLDVRPRRGLGEPVDRRDRRRASRRDHDRATRHQHVVADDDPPLAVEPPVSPDERDAALLEPGDHRAVVEVVDDLVAAREHRGDVELPDGDTRHAPRLGRELPGPEKRLRRHAGEERALAAHEPLLHDRNRETGLSEPAGDHLPGCPGADHDDVELALAHVQPPGVDSSRTR